MVDGGINADTAVSHDWLRRQAPRCGIGDLRESLDLIGKAPIKATDHVVD